MLCIPLALMACIGPLVSLETSHIQTEAEEHKEFTPVDQILKEYQEGKHRSFLNQIDKIYQSARKKLQEINEVSYTGFFQGIDIFLNMKKPSLVRKVKPRFL